MKKNRVIAIVFVVLAIVAGWLIMNNRKGTIKKDLRDFAVTDTANITKIFLADKTGRSSLLEKIKPGEWKINKKHGARNEAVNILLYTIKSVEVREPVGKKARENVIKSLASGGTKVEVYVHDKLFKVYYVGHETQDMEGTHMLLQDMETGENAAAPFIMYIPGFQGYLTTRYFTNEAEWRNRIVFAYTPPEIKSIKVTSVSDPKGNYEVVLNGINSFSLFDGSGKPIEKFDTLAVKQYLSYFGNIQFERLENDMAQAKRDSIANSKPICSVTVNLRNGTSHEAIFHYKFKPEAKHPELQETPKTEADKYDIDRVFAFVNNKQDLTVMQYYIIGKLLVNTDYFTNPKPVKK